MEENDKLLQKLERELNKYKAYIKEQGVDFAIDKAYELTVKQEIIDCIAYDSDLSKEQIKALLKFDNVLENCYDEWLNADGNLREHLNYSVNKSVEHITDDFKKEKIKTKNDAR